MVDLSIVVPVYNSEETLVQLTESLLKLEVGNVELILVNDGSEDGSASVCEQLTETYNNIVFIDLARNFGEHNAVLAGLRYTSGEYVITIDDDMQHSGNEILKLYEHVVDNKLDAVFGSFKRRQYAGWRNWGTRIADWTAQAFLGKPRALVLSTFRCLSRRLVNELVSYKGPYPYIDGMILKLTSRVANCLVSHFPRKAGKSNYTMRRLLRLWSHILFNFSIKPLRFSLSVGCIFFILAALGVLYVLVDKLVGVSDAPGWSSLMIVVLIFSGLQFIFLGVIGEYIGRIYMSVGGLPQSSVYRIIHSSNQETNNKES